MFRKLLIIVSLISLLFFGATVAMWVRGYRFSDEVALNDGDGSTFQVITSTRGRIRLVLAHARNAGDRTTAKISLSHQSDSPYDVWSLRHRFLGISWGEAPNVPPWFSRPAVVIPNVYLAASLLLLPGLCLGRALRDRRRRREGYCHRCGYDLRASGERCPECGAPISLRETICPAAS